MQLISRYADTPELYAKSEGYRKAIRPERCPCCGVRHTLHVHGHYERTISTTNSPSGLSAKIRRFRCSNCRRTVSVLPDFAQPYRYVASSVVGSFFSAGKEWRGLACWIPLLNRYWRKFTRWLPDLTTRLANTRYQGLLIGSGHAKTEWLRIERAFRTLAGATISLVARYGITLFGCYRCHQAPSGKTSHTTLLFPFANFRPCWAIQHGKGSTPQSG